MTVDERDVERRLRQRTEALGGRCIKITTVRGWPDRLLVLPGGHHQFVELKRPSGGRLSPAQRVVHEMLRRLGHPVEVAWSPEQVDQVIDRLKGENHE